MNAWRSAGLVLGSTLVCLAAAACSSDSAAAQKHFARANAYFDAKRFSEAIVEYRNVLQRDPRNAAARVRLAAAYEQTDDPRSAFREYVRAADLLPADDGVQVKAAEFLVRGERFADARARADVVKSRSPRDRGARVVLARALAGMGDVDAAVAELTDASSLAPGDPEPYTIIGALEYSRDRKRAAESAFRKAIAADPESLLAYRAFARFLIAEQRAREAEAILKVALRVNPSDPPTNYALATVYLATGRASDAEGPLKTAVAAAGDPNSQLALADYYVLTERHYDARVLLESLERQPATADSATIRLATLHYVEGHHDRAYATLGEVLRLNSHKTIALLTRGSFRLAENRPSEALPDLEAAVAADPQSVNARLLLASAHRALNRLDLAISEYREVLKLWPRATTAKYELAQLYLASGDPQQAVEYAEQAVASETASFDARLLLARSLLANLDVNRAESELRGLLQQHPDSGTLLAAMGTLSMSQGRVPAARQWFDRALAANPADLESVWGMAHVDLAEHRPDAARNRVNDRVAMTPHNGRALLVAGMALAHAGDSAGAEARLREAIEADPQLIEAYGRLGQLYLTRRQLDQAKQQFEAFLQQKPSSVAARTMIGVIAQLQGKTGDAEAAYARALDANPQAAVAANNLAWLYATEGTRLDIALQLAQTAVSRLPNDPRTHDTLGWIYYQKGLTSEAVATFRHAVEQEPNNPEFQYHMGLALLKNGDLLGAKRAIELALKLAPDFSGADQAKATLSRLGA